MSTLSYTPTINLGFNLSYFKDLELLFCSNTKCLTSINSSKSSNIVDIIKLHFKKHNISIRDTKIKRFLEEIKDYKVAIIDKSTTIENYKYFSKELVLTPRTA